MTQPTLRQRLQGLVATLALLLLVVGAPVLLVAIEATPWSEKLSNLRDLLTSPDDGTLALLVFAVVAWIAWAVVTVSVVIEAVTRVRGIQAPSLPGLGLPQRAAGQVVAVAALLFVATPTVAAAFPPAPANAAPARPAEMPRLTATAAAPVRPEAAPVPATATAPPKAKATVDYTVKRGDSLWKIADRLLGDGARYSEIVDLNRDVLNGRPDFIVSGTLLKIPHETAERDADRQAEEYVVKPGDTLSQIAEAKLGDPSLYPELFEASRDTAQPDSGLLTDPNLIRPGWQITIPGTPKHKADSPDQPGEVVPPGDVDPPVDTPPPTVEPTPIPTATTSPQPSTAAGTATTPNDVDEGVEAATPGWLVPGLTGAGAVLAGLVLIAVRAHRNTQLRYRRPGQTIAPPPPELRAVEKTAFVVGAPLSAAIKQLDRALRHLAATCAEEGRATPAVATITLARAIATLHLTEDADLPSPWEGKDRHWSTRLVDGLPDQDVIAPYPLLVSVGQDDAGLRLANLEECGVVALVGDRAWRDALARHIAAELALNPWSVLVDVDMIGVGAELALMDTMRLRHHATGERVLRSITRSLTAARDAGGGDPDPYRVVITTGDEAGDLAELLSSPAPRLGGVLIVVGASPVPDATVFELRADGRLRSPVLGIDVVAAGLTGEEAAACAAIVHLTRESAALRIPAITQAADGWRALADQGGALRTELTDVREEGPAGAGSLLPNPAQEYAEVAATTPEDVEALAPVVPEQVRCAIEEADPTLEQDVDAWFDPDSRRPRLMLLGPVNARAYGELAAAITKRKPYFVELLAFLALHPEGTAGGAVADAFSIASSRARTDLGYLRTWLGENPRTGHGHLPPANESSAYRETGVKAYQVEDLLIDVDLFRRLRARGQARGAEGIEDLKTAMRLVQGVPFSNLRERGWSWLLDGERLHETIGCSIVDTAHIIVIDALAKNDLATARETAQTACTAAPYDDICRLDLVKVAAAEGHGETADQMLTDDIFNRTDDQLPPIDLPGRTGEVVGKQGWGSSPPPGTA